MTTVNISLTDDQAQFVKKLTHKFGFANRSEFFRALLRSVSHDRHLIRDLPSLPFVRPSTRSKQQILSQLEQSGNYSKDFLADLQEGLDNSDYFTK